MKSQSEEEEDADDDQAGGVGIFPNYEPIFEEFNELIVWKKAGKQKVPEPVLGIDEEFDKKNQVVEDIKEELN